MKHKIIYWLLCSVLIISVFGGTFATYAEELDEEPSETNIEESTESEETDHEESTEGISGPETEEEAIEMEDSEAETEEQPAEETVEKEESENEIEELPSEEEVPSEEPTEDQSIEAEDREASDSTEENQETEQSQGEQQTRMQPMQNPGLADIRLLTNTTLNPVHESVDGGGRITLNYRGGSLLNLQLLSNEYAIFYLPTEIINVISNENLSGSYNTPGLLGVIRNRGNFDGDEIIIDGNQVYMEISNLVTLSLGSYYEFTLVIELDELPPTETGEYVFYSEATKQLVDLALISGNPARATLAAPQIPGAPIINEPIYTTDTTVTGTGEPNSTILLQIDGQEYEGAVDAAGNFSVAIPSQEAGTIVEGTIINEAGHASDAVSVTVEEPPDTTPPEPPDIDDVYSNDTVVTGRGEPDAFVELTIGGETYESTVNAEGDFSVDIPIQEPDTTISAVLIDDAGNISNSTEVSVIEATIAFHQVPDTLAFEETVIASGSMRIPRTDPDWSLEVIDTRGTGSPFSITADATPLTLAGGNHTLSDALVYIDSTSNSQSLNDGPIEVYTDQTGEDPISSVSWPNDEGPYIEVNPANARAGSYEATITWNIIDAP